MRLAKILNGFHLSCCSNTSCFCMNSLDMGDNLESSSLIENEKGQVVRIKDTIDTDDDKQTLAFHLKPKIAVLRVSMHCKGCARKVEKHISGMEGVSSFHVDLESKKVTVIGELTVFEVLSSVSKVKRPNYGFLRHDSFHLMMYDSNYGRFKGKSEY